MKCYVALGSNLGDRREMLQRAVVALEKLSSVSDVRMSPVYMTPALVPEGGPLEWFTPYLNMVMEFEWKESAHQLLERLKFIERELGRTPSPRWSPRLIDLDLITFGDETLKDEALQLPHPEMLKRSFVMDPLKDLAPSLRVPGELRSALHVAQTLPAHAPLVMGILNVTPDSFSDGGEVLELESFLNRAEKMIASGTHILDLGAESTRPGARVVSAEEEWLRLQRPLQHLNELFRGKKLRPLVSVDTRNARTAAKALEAGADWINDVSGLSDPDMLRVLRESRCDVVIMHHMGIPADPKVTIRMDLDPVLEVMRWIHERLQLLDENGISQDRVIVDPGIGFGKTAHQSLALLKRAKEFRDLPVRVLFGHSRKSFMKIWSESQVHDRDPATLGASLQLAAHGVDVLRVHAPEAHLHALQARLELV